MQLEYRLRRMTSDDASLTVQWMVKQYGFAPAEVWDWVRNLHFNWSMSVMAQNPGGEPVGLLNMSDYRIEEETSLIVTERPTLLAQLNAMHYIAVFSFIVAESYRGTRLNYDMLMELWPDLCGYDFLFIPVMHSLQTHRYWKRWGAVEFFRDPMSVYYLLPMKDETRHWVMSGSLTVKEQ